MDFYGVKIGKTQGEILAIVDLATRETMLRCLPDQTQDRVVKTLLHSAFYPRGVPLFMRSDNAPQLMQGAARDTCTCLGIDQIVTGGHSPRGNAICERVNQSLGSMIRKMSDEDYKNLKDLLPALEHAINVTCNSAIGCTPFEVGHGLAARSIAEARLSLEGARGTDPDSLEDANSVFDESKIKLQVELAARVLEDARAISEWHRRMASRKPNQSGQEIDLKAMKVGAKACFYKPPTIKDVERLGRKAKHINHCVGPGTMKEIIGDRNFVIERTNPRTGKCHEFQRGAGMVLLKKPDPEASGSSNVARASSRPCKHKKGTIPREGEFIITNCVPGANT
jgi:transposase InsO family protein